VSKVSGLEFDITTEESNRTQPTLKSVETSDVSMLETNIQFGRQYIPSDTLQIDNGFKPSNESSFHTPAFSLRFNHGPDLARSSAATDLLATIFCFAAVHFAYLGSLNFTSHRTVALLGSLVFMILALSVGGMYNAKKLRKLNGELTNLLLCWMYAFAAVGLFTFLTKTAGDVSRVWMSASMILTLASLTGLRVLRSMGLITGKKAKARSVVVCGNAESIKPVMRSIYELSNQRVRVAKIFEFPSIQSQDIYTSDFLQMSADQISSFVEKQRESDAAIEQVWIAVSADQAQVVEELSKKLTNSTVDVCVAPDLYTKRLLDGETDRFGETNIVNISDTSLASSAEQFKRVFDVVIASIALLFLCIPMAIIAMLIKSGSEGPAVFRQKRYGIDGKSIEVFKFRSMLVHTDTQVLQATKNDTRVTRIGKVLRKTSLDELPQLINVLQGTMSLVGPRPHAVAHNELWRNQIEGYMLRHKVRPGITGLAQVNGWRGETDTAYKMQQRVKFDLAYIRNWSPWLDIKIIFLTVAKGFCDKNAY